MFKERLKEIRTENNVKQVELANFLGVRNTTVSAWETGDNEIRIKIDNNYIQSANLFYNDKVLDQIKVLNPNALQ